MDGVVKLSTKGRFASLFFKMPKSELPFLERKEGSGGWWRGAFSVKGYNNYYNSLHADIIQNGIFKFSAFAIYPAKSLFFPFFFRFNDGYAEQFGIK